MKAFYILLVLTAFPLCSTYASSSIYNLCPNVRKLQVVSSPKDLLRTMCNLQNDYSDNHEVINLTSSVIETIKIISGPAASANWEKSELLNLDLEALSDKLSEINNSTKVVAPKTQLQKAISNLNNKWRDEKVRADPKNFNAYILDFKKIMSLTKTGKKVLDCYEKAKGPLISGEEILPIPQDLKDQGAKMAFTILEDKNVSNKFVKTIYFNTEPSPFDAITAFAHELQHGCNTNVQAKMLSQAYLLPEDSKEYENVQSLIQQDNAVDEMRAYKVSVDMFKDLAEASPGLVCSSYSKSALLGKQILSAAEYAANLDDKIEDGTYPQYLISLYAAHGFYKPEYVLQKDKDGQIVNKLREDLIEKMRNEGVYVAR